MDKPKITPKDFFLWLGAMGFFYVSVFSFVGLIFSYLDYVFPDVISGYMGDPYAAGISYQMASLIVLFPIFLVLMRVIHKSIEADATRADVWVRRWALYLTLFIAGVTVAGDLITLVMYFFNGDVTLRFTLKVLLILLVAGGGFLHFLADLRGYWEQHPSKARTLSYATALLIVISIGAGFFIVGTPWQARLYRYDEQKVSDLQNIQSWIVNYWQTKQELPTSLANLNDPISGIQILPDAQTGTPYEYTVRGTTSFELCATFNAESMANSVGLRSAPMMYPTKEGVADNWTHSSGRVCYSRTIDPERYPPYSTMR